MGKPQTYEDIHRRDIARAVFVDVFGGPLRDGCFKLSIAGTLDLEALRRVKLHLDLTIGFFEEDASTTPTSAEPGGGSDAP